MSFLKKSIKDPNILGIDLGTTNSVVSIMKDKYPIILKNENGNPTTPSIINITNKEIVGEAAKNLLDKDSNNTLFATKRLIGRKFKELDLLNYTKTLPYKTYEHCNGDVWIKTDFRKISPAAVGAKILDKMKKIGEKYLGTKVTRAVVTVPAYFNDCQRQATKDAGKIAGLDVLRVINEPTAAALAYGIDKKEQGNIAVYDLGGGTFDVTILELDKDVFHVKSTNGHTFLGGEDFDNEFVNFLVRMYESEEGCDVSKHPMAMKKLKIAAEKAKIELSNKRQVKIQIDDIIDGKSFDLDVTREQLENVVKRVANKTIEPCELALKDAKLKKKDIKHVILVGGMTKMPLIRKLVENIFGQKPYTNIDPDEAVAKGAAIQGGIISGSLNNLLLLDVCPLSLGIEILGGLYSKIVNRNTTIPFRETQRFSTSENDQEEVDINIYQGERALVKDNMLLGKIKLTNIPKAKKGVPKIDVTFEADSNGIIHVNAQDGITKEMRSIEIVPSSGFTEDEIKKLIKEAESSQVEDEKKKECVEFRLGNKDLVSKLINDTKKKNKSNFKKLIKLENDLKKDVFDIKEAERIINTVVRAE